jgi:DNA transposition AAA+ family ATPase
VETDRLGAVIKRHEQVYNRFQSSHRFGKLSGEEFGQTVEVWEKKVFVECQIICPLAKLLTTSFDRFTILIE